MRRLWPLFGPQWSWWLVLFTLCVSGTSADVNDIESKEQTGKSLPVFSVVTFPNENCEGDKRNGTCYTSEECSNKGGTSGGECAQGFGVCCEFTLSCGGTSSENCTYLVQAATTTFTMNVCQYTICKCSSNICRIRYDFTTMQIEGPVTDTTAATAARNTGTQTGDCTSDTITFTGAGTTGAPVICGTNTGQHLYVDATDECHTTNINLNTAATTSRTWDIKATQYECGSEHGGPPGCLQYFTSLTGTVASFNFPTTAAVGATATHLSSQDYKICFRRGSGKCFICYSPVVDGSTAAIAQNSFGLSIGSSAAAAAKSGVDTICTTDYLEIPGANTMAIAMAGTIDTGTQRLCGRIFGTVVAGTIATETVCTNQQPFQIRFVADADEVIVNAATAATALNSENDTAPGGIVGFKMAFTQGNC